MDEEILCHLGNEVAAAEPYDRLVKFDICFRIFIQMVGKRLILELIK